jgi:hypothetical protein
MGGQRQASAVLTPEERRSSHCAGGWVGRWAGVHGCGKSLSHRVSIPGPFSPQRVDIPTELTRPTVRNMNSLRNSRHVLVVGCENLSAMTASTVVLDVTPSRLVERYQV